MLLFFDNKIKLKRHMHELFMHMLFKFYFVIVLIMDLNSTNSSQFK